MSARTEALKDIKNSIPVKITHDWWGYPEVWTVGVTKLNTTVNSRLNEQAIKSFKIC